MRTKSELSDHKGIKLGTAGVEPIEAFQKASTRAELPDEPQNLTKSAVRVYQADKANLEVIFNALGLLETDSQQKNMRAFIAWAKQQLESLEEIQIEQSQEKEIETTPEQQQSSAQTEVVETMQSTADTDMHRQESPLEQKIDRLVTVMETLVMAQLNQKQQTGDLKTPTIPKVDRTASDVSPTPRTRASSTDSTERLNQAIDAIMNYNNAEGRLHDQKWAITINALKSWGKSQPKIMQALEARKEEISQHHQLHQIDSISHNYKHRGKRKIDEVIQIPNSNNRE